MTKISKLADLKQQMEYLQSQIDDMLPGLEVSIDRALQDFAAQLFNEHGIYVESIRVNWATSRDKFKFNDEEFTSEFNN